MRNKKSLILLSSCLAVTLGVAVAYTTVSAETATKTEPTTLTLESGARVKFGTEEGGNGLRYTLQMNKSEYTNFMNSSYTDVTFGVLIAPEFYQTKYGAFDEKNVFGIGENAQAVYDWATWGDTDGDGENSWEYDEESELTQIINLSTTELVEFTKESTTLVQYKGSIVDLDPASITGEFRGVGYVTYKDNGVLKCKMVTGDNVRTMAYVANEAIKGYQNDLLDDELTEDEIKAINDKITLLNNNYMTKVSDVEYKVNHHYVKADGTETVDTEDLSAKATTLIEATAKASEYFTYDEKNEDNVLTGTAKAGVELDVYYTQNTQALSDAALMLDVDSTTTLTIPTSVSTSVTNALIGGTSVWSALDGTTLTLSNVDQLATNGLTDITYVTDTYAYTQEVDVYTLENFTSESFMKEGTTLVGGVANHYDNPQYVKNEYLETYEGETNVYSTSTVTNGYNEALGVAVMPRHTNAYYNALHTKYASKGLYLSYRVYIEDVSGKWTTRNFSDLGAGNVGSWTTGEWHTVLINSTDYKAAINSSIDSSFTRFDALRDKYYYASNGLKIPAPTDTNWSLDGLPDIDDSGASFVEGDSADGHNSYCCRGYLARIGTYNSGAKATAIYVTEPMIILSEDSLLLDLAKVDNATSIKASELIGDKYPDFHINSLTLNGTTVTMPTENTLLSDYTIEGLTNGQNTVVLTAVNKTYGGYMMKQPVTVFNGTIDAYNLNNGAEFTVVSEEWLNAGNVKASRYDNAYLLNTISVATAEQIAADTDITMGSYTAKGNYYLYNMADTTKCEHGLWVKPTHSKAYYEMLKELGKTKITYDYYVADPDGKTGSIGYNGTTTHTEASGKNAWYQASISIDNLIEYYDYYSTGVNYNKHYRYTEVLHLGWVDTHNAKFYVGNFQIVE